MSLSRMKSYLNPGKVFLNVSSGVSQKRLRGYPAMPIIKRIKTIMIVLINLLLSPE